MIQLRQYQIDCLEAIKRKANEGKRRLIASLPTAAGKTVIFSALIKDLGERTLVLAHTGELLDQAKSKIEMTTGIPVGIVNQFNKEFETQVVVSSIQSAVIPSNLNQLVKQRFGLLIYDESHRAASDGARKVLNALGFGKDTKKLLCGFTATPFRHSKSKGLAEVFDDVAFEIGAQELIAQGYLVPPVGYMIANDLDLSSVKTTDGDFQEASLAEIMDAEDMVDAVIDSWKKKAAGRKTIAFGVSVKHSQHMADCFVRNDISAKLIHGGMDHDDRIKYLEEYRTGDLKVLCNAQVLVEGVDLPETSCIILSPTRSQVKFQQACGRGLRPAPWINKKDCIILNFGDTDHKICSVAMLFPDAELQAAQVRSKASLLGELPPKLNPKLKTAIASFDPLGQAFSWQHADTGYIMKGNNDRVLAVVPQSNARWGVTYTEDNQIIHVADGLDFEYAFGTAEEFAKEHRHFFALTDLEAPWRKHGISDKQKEIFRSYGFKTGIDDLTKGQAAILIGSGILGRRKRGR